ncbi:MAG: hypothetical protein RQ741_11920, partial [Wenzhouxiangellaceae bacterium]|nr:hypothetical protein [Wenzhouxiangellaceae bacterium]
MTGSATRLMAGKSAQIPGVSEPAWMERLVIVLSVGFLATLLLAPLVLVFGMAFSKGIDTYLRAISEPAAWSAIKLTLIAAAISVPINTVFGVAAAWAITKFEFPGKSTLISLIDVPF